VPSASMTMPQSWQHSGPLRADITAFPRQFAQRESSELWRETFVVRNSEFNWGLGLTKTRVDKGIATKNEKPVLLPDLERL